MNRQEEILEIIENCNNLPALPEIISELRELLSETETDINSIQNLIQYDVALSASIIRAANTTKFNYRTNRINSLPDAIKIIGYDNIIDIVLTIKVINLFKQQSGLNYQQFWLHCLTVGFCMSKVKKLLPKLNLPADGLYTAGLLHEIGILALDYACPQYYSQVIHAMSEYPETPLCRIEQEFLGITSSEISNLILKKWKLPLNIIDSIRYINKPLLASIDPQLCNLMHIVNFACNNQGIHNGIDVCLPESFSENAWNKLDLSIDLVSILIKEIQKENANAFELIAYSGQPH